MGAPTLTQLVSAPPVRSCSAHSQVYEVAAVTAAGLPDGVLNIVVGDAPSIGAAPRPGRLSGHAAQDWRPVVSPAWL